MIAVLRRRRRSRGHMRRVGDATPSAIPFGTPSRQGFGASICVVMLIAGGAVLTADAGAAFPGENGQIAFERETIIPGDDPLDFQQTWDVFTMNDDGTGQTELTTESERDFAPAFSADGSKIVFHTNRHGTSEIYVMHADGTGQTRLTNDGDSDASPAFSPDGSKIAFESDGDIYVMNADGTGETRLTEHPAADARPSFSPDGAKIVFDADREGSRDIYIMNADGTDETRLTEALGFDDSAAFSPDGGTIAFGSDRDGDYDVYTMNVDGSNESRLINNNPGVDSAPEFSPDGTKMVFVSSREGNRDIYVMNDDGTEQTRLTTAPDGDTLPDWGPKPAPPPDSRPKPAAPSPPPPDGDGNPASDADPGPETHERSLTLFYSKKKRAYRGRISSDEEACTVKETVQIFKRSSRGNLHRKVNKDETNATGKFRARRKHPDKQPEANRYARVAEKTLDNGDICAAARSKRLRP